MIMKRFLLLFLVALVSISCQEEGLLTEVEVGSIPISPDAVLKYSGTFIPTSGINVAGGVKIYRDGNQFKLSLDEFDVSFGPDLKIYLSTSASPNAFINLGALGNGEHQTYLIPAEVDFNLYNHVLIYCQQYSHLYAIAELHQN
jgi:hypothetical protein